MATDYTADANCQGAWLMEADTDPITDSSANTNTGAHVGDPTHATASPPPGGFSTGYYTLDGVADSFDIANHASLDPGGDFSIVAWIKMVSYGDNSYGRIFDSYHGVNGGYSWYVDDVAVSDGMSLNIRDAVGLEFENSDASILSTGTWYHVAVVFDDSANTVTFYVNGVEKGIKTNSKTPTASGVNATIGDRDGNDRQFQGDITQVAFFDRTLSLAEIIEIKDYGLDGSGTVAVGWWGTWWGGD